MVEPEEEEEIIIVESENIETASQLIRTTVAEMDDQIDGMLDHCKSTIDLSALEEEEELAAQQQVEARQEVNINMAFDEEDAYFYSEEPEDI